MRYRSLSPLLAFLTLLWPQPLARADSGSHGPAFIIRNVRIFDGEKLIDANSVAVADGKITAVGSSLPVPPGAKVIDGTGDTLLPGLIDSHVHLWQYDELRRALVFGSTTVLDMFMRWQDVNRWKQEESKDGATIADFRTAGYCFATPGGHGTEDGFDTTITTPQQASGKVDQRIAEGSDYIKIMYEDGPRFAAMPKPVMEAIVKAAHQRGKMVIVHGTSLDIPDAGADGLAHLPIAKLPEPQWTDALKAHHMFVITTIAYTDFHLTPGRLAAKLPDDPLVNPYLGPAEVQALRQPQWHNSDTAKLSYSDSEKNLMDFRAAGIPLLAGTDIADNGPIGALLYTELELMVKAGIPPAEALADATSVPARIFSLNDRGRIAPGLRADLLLVRGDPTKDIRRTRDIVAIWKQGVAVDREAFRKEVAQQWAAWSLAPGWSPVASEPSTVHVERRAAERDPKIGTVTITGNVKPGTGFLGAGITYNPWHAFNGASNDLSGSPTFSFRARGDGKTYSLTLYYGKGDATTKYFVASKDWKEIIFPFSAFGFDGKHVNFLEIASSTPGPFHLELSDAHIGARRWIGLDIESSDPVVIGSVNENSPASRSGLRAGDVVTSFDGKPIKKYADFLSALGTTHLHERVAISIARSGEPLSKTVEIGERTE